MEAARHPGRWHHPATPHLTNSPHSHGHIALGYQLRQHMPPIAQRTFPQQGFTLYDSDDQVAALLQHAGFTPPDVRVFGDPAHPGGRLALATPVPGRCEQSAHRQDAHF